MNILYINPILSLFERTNTGSGVRSTLFIKALSRLAHVDVISFGYNDDPGIPNCDVINIRAEERAEERAEDKSYPGKFWLDMLFRPADPYTYYRVDRNIEKILDGHISKNDYDYIACRTLKQAAESGLLKYSDRLILDTDDSPSGQYKIMVSTADHPSAYARWKSIMRSRLIGRMTEKVLPGIFCTFHSNPLEKPWPGSVLLKNTTMIQDTVPDIDDSTPCRLLTVGYLDYYPNKEGIFHFVEKVFPMVRSAVPGVELHVAGLTYDPSIIDSLNSFEGVKALGFVKDIVKEYRDSRVIVIPVNLGTGTSVKFVEGLMMNRPMVSTPAGVRGFEDICKDGEHFLLARDDDDFAGKIIGLLKSVDKSKQLSTNALQVGKAHFSQDAFMFVVENAVLSRRQEHTRPITLCTIPKSF